MSGRKASEGTTRPTRGDFLFIEHRPKAPQTNRVVFVQVADLHGNELAAHLWPSYGPFQLSACGSEYGSDVCRGLLYVFNSDQYFALLITYQGC